MDFLTICRRVNDAVGFQGTVTSVSATGYQATLTQAVKDAYEDIQRYRPDWEFMKRDKTVSVGSSANEYTLATLWGSDTPDLATWKYINYDYKLLRQITYDSYVFQDLTSYTAGKPNYYAIEPYTQSLLITPVDTTYSLDIHYIRDIHLLSENSDTPILPTKFHMAIVYGAIMKLSTFIGNQTLYDTHSANHAMILGQLMRDENPAKTVRKRPVA